MPQQPERSNREPSAQRKCGSVLQQVAAAVGLDSMLQQPSGRSRAAQQELLLTMDGQPPSSGEPDWPANAAWDTGSSLQQSETPAEGPSGFLPELAAELAPADTSAADTSNNDAAGISDMASSQQAALVLPAAAAAAALDAAEYNGGNWDGAASWWQQDAQPAPLGSQTAAATAAALKDDAGALPASEPATDDSAIEQQAEAAAYVRALADRTAAFWPGNISSPAEAAMSSLVAAHGGNAEHLALAAAKFEEHTPDDDATENHASADDAAADLELPSSDEPLSAVNDDSVASSWQVEQRLPPPELLPEAAEQPAAGGGNPPALPILPAKEPASSGALEAAAAAGSFLHEPTAYEPAVSRSSSGSDSRTGSDADYEAGFDETEAGSWVSQQDSWQEQQEPPQGAQPAPEAPATEAAATELPVAKPPAAELTVNSESLAVDSGMMLDATTALQGGSDGWLQQSQPPGVPDAQSPRSSGGTDANAASMLEAGFIDSVTAVAASELGWLPATDVLDAGEATTRPNYGSSQLPGSGHSSLVTAAAAAAAAASTTSLAAEVEANSSAVEAADSATTAAAGGVAAWVQVADAAAVVDQTCAAVTSAADSVNLLSVASEEAFTPDNASSSPGEAVRTIFANCVLG